MMAIFSILIISGYQPIHISGRKQLNGEAMKTLKLQILSYLFLFALLIIGCSASGPAFQRVKNIPEGQALIYFYRVGSMASATETWQVKVNDVDIVSMSSGGYYPYFCEPGYAKIEGSFGLLGWNLEPIDLNIKPNQTYYIRFHIEGFFPQEFIMDIPDKTMALLELYDCNLQE